VSSAPQTHHPFRFSSFEADPQSGELRKNGVRLRIQDQPFQILLKLLERPGQVVTREELKAALWSADTFVDFDNGLNMAVKRLREVLADDADLPRFIETLPRRGYRFIAAVQSSNFSIEAPQPSSPQRRLTSGIQRRVVLASLLCLFVVAGIIAWIGDTIEEMKRRYAPSGCIQRATCLVSPTLHRSHDNVLFNTVCKPSNHKTPNFSILRSMTERTILV
jgi:DNA-binding winged helix-turn-helix (wHTH) protein